MTQDDIDRIAKQSAKKLDLPSRRMRIIRQWFDRRLWNIQYGYIVVTDKLTDLSYKLRGKQRPNIMTGNRNKTRACNCEKNAPHSIHCLEYDADKKFKNRFIERHPNWYDSDEYFTLNFNTTDELLQCEYVTRWKKDTDDRKFYRYSLSIDEYSPPMLMVEYNQGTSWWCLGRLRTTDGLNLPKWKPVYEGKD